MSVRIVKFLLACLVLVPATSCVTVHLNNAAPSAWLYEDIQVEANRRWTDTRIDLKPGQELVIRYEMGQWSPWPGGSYDALGSGGDPRCDCNVIRGVSHAALIGQIDESEPFLVGEHYAQVVGRGGRLWLSINDTRIDDNHGSITVDIEIHPED